MTEDEKSEVLAAAERLRDYTARYRAAVARRDAMNAEYDALSKECSTLFVQMGQAQSALIEIARPGVISASDVRGVTS